MITFRVIEDLIKKWSATMSRAFWSAIDLVRSRIGLGTLSSHISKMDIEAAVSEVDLDPVAFGQMETVLAQSFQDAGETVIDSIRAGRTPLGGRLKSLFNMRDPRVVAWLEENGANMITRIIDDQKSMIRRLIADGLVEGRTPSQIALDLVGRIDPVSKMRQGGALGLSGPQEEWARTYRDDLKSLSRSALKRAMRDKRYDVMIDNAIKEGRQLSPEVIDVLVARYRDNALKLRGNTVAQAEIKAATHAAQMEAYDQAIANGQIMESDLEKMWRSRRDDKVRDTHEHLDGVAIPFRSRWLSSSGASLNYPGDPEAPAEEIVGCRCRMIVRVRRM